MNLIILTFQGGITTLNSNFVKEFDAAVRDLEATSRRIDSQLQGNIITEGECRDCQYFSRLNYHDFDMNLS